MRNRFILWVALALLFLLLTVLPANYGATPDASISATPDASISTDYFENNSLTLALVETNSLSGGEGEPISGSEVARDAVALTDGDAGATFFLGAPVIDPDGPFFPAGTRRATDGFDTETAADWVIGSFSLSGANTPSPEGLDGRAPLDLTVPEIQGMGQRSIYEGEVVRTRGVVTLLSADGRDMWIQDPVGDGDPATSDGIMVDDRDRLTPSPQVGDLIELTATVEELQFGTALPLTRLNDPDPGTFATISSSEPSPVPVLLTDLPNEVIAEGIAFWEPLEGMLVAVEDGFVVAPTSEFGEFALVVEADALADLGSGYLAQTKQILIRSLGSGIVDYNPERILVDDSSLSHPIVVMPGDRVRHLVGVVDYTFGNYKLQPASYELKTHDLPNLPASKRSGPEGDVTITTFNVENLFDLVDDPVKDDEGSTPTPEELEVKLVKLALAVQVELSLPEILVVQEVENTAILQELGDRVNGAAGTSYTAVSFETSDARGIEVGFLWDGNRVSLLDAYQLSGPDVETAFGPSSPSPGREPLVGVFEVAGRVGHPVRRSTSDPMTIVGNHFRSKNGDDPLFGVNWPPKRVTEVQRKAQARVVRDFVDAILSSDPHALVMVAGDLNDLPFDEPGEGADHPLAILEGGVGEVPLTNLVRLEKEAERYTFLFDGNSQVLDHMLVSPGLYERWVAVDILHCNAGYPSALGEDGSTPLRASDHDPLEGRFRLR